MTTETKTIEKKLISVRLHGDDLSRLKTVKEAKNFHGNFADFMTTFIDQSTGVELFQDKDYAKLKAAADKLGVSVESIIIKGALKFAAKAMTADPAKQLNSVDMKVQAFVEGVMTANEKAKEWFDKREITQGFIVKAIKESTGKEVNRANVTAYLAANVEEITSHHEKCGIEPDQNRKVFNYERKNKKA
jgi:hypothetical protein